MSSNIRTKPDDDACVVVTYFLLPTRHRPHHGQVDLWRTHLPNVRQVLPLIVVTDTERTCFQLVFQSSVTST